MVELNKISLFQAFWRCLFSPKLYRIYNKNGEGIMYEANHLEKWGDQIITSLFIAWHVGVYTSPVLMFIMYKKGYFLLEGAITLTKVAVGVGFLLATSYGLRSFGRINTPSYLKFQKTLTSAKKNLNAENKKALMVYDFDFEQWPVEFRWNEVEGDDSKTRRFDSPSNYRVAEGSLMYVPCSIISYLAAHSIGIRLIYPGSVSALGYMMSPLLLQGRATMIEKDDGERFKLKAHDGNEIDAFFVDRRDKRSGNGSTLVICSEGNAGFYEIGIMVTPLRANYSVLGWNHPGFGGSTGMPYPNQEQNAMDVVMQFAIHKLGFLPEQIVLFGWSIGGYTTAWAAKAYPDVKAVVSNKNKLKLES
uniref:Uncharacterized protein n=1 Tax=Clastoptera arizonana TaxID=38151 RepID=A0A1B6CN26_9HEMI